MSEDQVKKGLEQCNLCNVALVSAIKERVARGESVNEVCKDYETFQRQLHGEVLLSANALRQRYMQATGEKKRTCSKGTTGGRPPKYQPKSEKPSSTPTEGFEYVQRDHDQWTNKKLDGDQQKLDRQDGRVPLELPKGISVSGGMEYTDDLSKLANEFDHQVRKLQFVVDSLKSLKLDFEEANLEWNQARINKVIGGLK